jgi:excisionase family DNA binding protein
VRSDAHERGLTTREVSRLLRVSEDKVRAWIAAGLLGAINTSTCNRVKTDHVIAHVDLLRAVDRLLSQGRGRPMSRSVPPPGSVKAEDVVIRLNTEAEPGRLLPALADLLIDLVRREVERRAAPPAPTNRKRTKPTIGVDYYG